MSTAEVIGFESLPGYLDAVELRRFDDMGKADGASVPALDQYIDLLQGLTGRVSLRSRSHDDSQEAGGDADASSNGRRRP